MQTTTESVTAKPDELTEAGAVPREHFIPVRKADLVAGLSSDASLGEDRSKFRQLCRLLEATIHYDYHTKLESLKCAYAPFDPDADTVQVDSGKDGENTKSLFDEFTELLERANYKHLSSEEIEQALDETGDWGLDIDVDFDIFSRLEIFARGLRTESATRRPWYRFFREETSEYEIYSRLILIFKLTDHHRTPSDIDTNTVYIKIFKSVPKADLDSLLPGTAVRMTLLDKGKVALPTISGIVIAGYKLFTVLVLAAMNIIAFLGIIVATIGYGVKSFFGYLRTKEKHQHNLTRNLYFQNLDNNAGVLFRLLDEAEEQEFREAILAYFLLLQNASAEGRTMKELDDEAEAYLLSQFKVDADFEVDDALDKLQRFQMVTCGGDRYRAVPIDDVLRQLDETWDNYFQFNVG